MIIVVMGVAGSGKSTIARLLAARFALEWIDADDLHPPANVAKMSSGIPLDDKDREAWLEFLCDVIGDYDDRGRDLVLACSALKEPFRRKLRSATRKVRFVYLRISKGVAEERVAGRPDHFMPAALVASQFEALEEPLDAITVDATLPPATIVDVVADRIGEF